MIYDHDITNNRTDKRSLIDITDNAQSNAINQMTKFPCKTIYYQQNVLMVTEARSGEQRDL